MTAASPYRELVPVTVEALQRENERLRKELAALRGEELLPYRHQIGGGCRMCGSLMAGSRLDDKDPTKHVVCYIGPDAVFVPAYTPSWLGKLFGHKPRPESIRRTCRACKAVYYEMPAHRTPIDEPKT